MIIKSNTNLFPILDFSTYGGTCDSEGVLHTSGIDEDYKEGYCDFTLEEFHDNFDNKAYMQHLEKTAANFIVAQILPKIQALNIGVTDIVVTGHYSPKYYNFETDTLDFDLVVVEDFKERLLALIETVDQDALEKYLKENFSSYDGFWSHTSNNISDLKDCIITDVDCREANVFLWWYLTQKDEFFNANLSEWDNYQESWLYYLEENSHYADFIDQNFVPKSKDISIFVEQYTRDNYRERSFDEMLEELTSIAEEKDWDLEKVVEEFKENHTTILSHSLTFEF